MFEGDYSKKVWIISIIMAIGCIAVDLMIILGENPLMKDMTWITMPVAVFILYKSIVGLINKIKEEKNDK